MTSALSKRQIEYLDRYGYPFVFDDFRFHMTLTGALAVAQRERIIALLRKRLMDVTRRPSVLIGALSIAVQASPRGRFRVVHQSALGSAAGGRPGATVGELQRRIVSEWS